MSRNDFNFGYWTCVDPWVDLYGFVPFWHADTWYVRTYNGKKEKDRRGICCGEDREERLW